MEAKRGRGNADEKWSEKKMEAKDNVRTVDCLRGRLLAERMASRNAKEEAEQLGNKLIELENTLKEEAKSRNRAEKKLRVLMKKLESMNISYVSDESEQSSLTDKSDISSVSSTSSSRTKELEEKCENSLKKISEKQELENVKSSKGSGNMLPNDPLIKLEPNFQESEVQELGTGPNETPIAATGLENLELNVAQNTIAEDALSSAGETLSENSSQLNCNRHNSDSKMDEQSVKSCAEESDLKQEDDQDPDHTDVDNSMAIILVNTPQENRTIDPEVLDATVKQVLDALKHAREQLQSSMEKRRTKTVKVG